MARPPSKDPKEVVALRLRRSTLDVLRRKAGKASVGSWLSGVLERQFGRAVEAGEEPPSEAADCPHPKAKEKNHGWGIVCGECGRRLR